MRYRWVVLGAGVFAQAALSAVQLGLPAIAPVLRDELGLSLNQVGVVLACVSWGITAPLLAWGWLADRAGERIVVSVGLAGGALALVAGAYTAAYAGLVLSLAATGALAGSRSDREGRRVPLMCWIGVLTAVALLATALLAEAPLPALVPALLAAGVLSMSWNGLSVTAAAELSGPGQTGAALGLKQTAVGLGAGTGVGFAALVGVTSWPAAFALLAALPLAGSLLLRPLVAEERVRTA